MRANGSLAMVEYLPKILCLGAPRGQKVLPRAWRGLSVSLCSSKYHVLSWAGERKHCCRGQRNISAKVLKLSMLTRRRVLAAGSSARKWTCRAAATNSGGWDQPHPQRDSVDEEWQV